MKQLSIPLVALACLGCPAERSPLPPPDPTVKPPPPPVPTAPAGFENPGGMWTPDQLPAHAETLKRLGLGIDVAALADPKAAPLGAVVSLGGCSASFVSPEGLIITNHHCATGALQFNSTKEKNLLEDGFLAKTRAEEKNNGPRARVFVTQKFTDVTSRLRAGLAEEKDDLARFRLAEKHEKELLAECEKDRPEIRCSVVSYYGTEKYVLIEQLEIRDVRLVYSPAEGIGNFGGEIDNWRWPRHTGDYSFFRAYVGPDGKPADFDPKNVPYRPPHHLEIATSPLQQGDLVFVAGYPGQTSRLKTAAEVTAAVDWFYPRRQKMCEEYIPLLEALAKQDPALDIAGRGALRGFGNSLTNVKGMLDGLQKGGLKVQKEEAERQLRRWIAKQPDQAGAAQALDRLEQLYAKYQETRDADAATWEILSQSLLLSAAEAIAHMAEERPKPDAERNPDFQARNHKRLEQAQQQGQQSYDRRLDKARLKLALTRAARLPRDKQPAALALIAGNDTSERALDVALDALYATTKLEKADERIRLLKTASTATLRASKDPFIRLGLALRPLTQAIDDRDDAYVGAVMMVRPAYIAALRTQKGGVLAPDANGTLRVTYGTVRGYRPRPDAEVYYPFTKLSEMVKKHTGTEPFDAPDALVTAAKSGPFGPYLHPAAKEVTIDFLADLDITGGNSGSPTLNARGELVGLVFDGNYEAMASDWVFIPAVTRSIHVDIRYVLWIMDKVDGADHLLREMGIDPALE